MILNTKGVDSGVNPSVMDTIDLSNVRTRLIRMCFFSKELVFSFIQSFDVCVCVFFFQATRKEARRACNSIFQWSFGKYKKVHAFVEFVTRINNRDKIILRIQNQKIWRIAFSLHGLTWPKDEEPYADEAIELLRTTISQRLVEVII